MVHHAQQALGPLAVAALSAAALAGCGGGGGSASSAARTSPAVVRTDLGTDYRLANCVDWRRGNRAQRQGTVQEIGGFAGQDVGNNGGVGNTLNPEQAYALFDRWCALKVARHFKLYKLYTRAAAFTPPQQ